MRQNMSDLCTLKSFETMSDLISCIAIRHISTDIILFSSHEGAFKADNLCYETYNLRGDIHGYCKRHSATSYMACTSG